MEKNKIKVALVQMDSQADRARNIEKIKNAVREAAEAGAEFVMFPETVDYIGPEMKSMAVDVNEELVPLFQELAKKYGLYLQAGSVSEKRESVIGQKTSNLSMIFSPEGERIVSYRKLHLFDVDVADGPAYKESDDVEAGNEIVMAETPFGKLGMSICYDIRFPQMYRIMAEAGCEILLVSANFTDTTGQAHWEVLLRARAIENSCYVLACDQCGQKSAFLAHGNSMVIDPWGRIIARAGKEEEILYAEIDRDFIGKCRRQVPSLNNHRSDV